MKVAAFGSRFHGGQIDRIEQGFIALGHEVTPHTSEADLVYVNDAGHYAQVIADRAAGRLRPDAKVIFTVLDLAPHLGAAFPLATVFSQLSHADAVTTISATVQRDITARIGISTTVIYNPIKPVTRVRETRHAFRAMFVGRINDPEKRCSIAAEALGLLGFAAHEVVTVGNERPFYGGVHWGVASDETLAELYNSVDFLMCPTRNAFLGLPMLEAAAAGCVPIICNDLDVRQEFFPSDVFPEYAAVNPDAHSIAAFMRGLMDTSSGDDRVMERFKHRIWHHYISKWHARLSPRGVAAAIMRVYEGLL